MSRRSDPLRPAQHRKIGVDLFNYSWTILVQKERSPAEEEELLHAAHASYYHWTHSGATARNRSIGEWHLSRVYAVLGRAEPAMHHGRRALDIARKSHLAPFYVGYGYEALARAAALAGKPAERERYLKEARRVTASVRSAESRRMLLEDLGSIP